jgi:carboxylate-amine ligase
VTARKIGIEEEFLLFRVDAPELLDVGPRVVAAAARRADDERAQFEKELKAAQAELATSPDTDLGDIGTELAVRRAELVAAAAEREARVVASGTSPVTDSSATTHNDRYRRMSEAFAAVERRQLTCAMHVHVSVHSEDEGVRVLNGIAAWLPALTALSANSPFHAGQDTGYASFRRVQWGEWPTAGPTGPFADADDYHRTVSSLIATGAAQDRGMVYFDARLSANYPTVEIRVCDVCADLDTALALAALCRALVSTASTVSDERAPVRPEVLRAAHWRAARYGMSDELVDLTAGPELVPAWKLVEGLVDRVSPALDEAGDASRVREMVDRIRAEGTGADRQRAAVDRANGDVAGAVDVATLQP